MPKIIKDENGNDIEVFEKAEVEQTRTALEAKMKELEQEVNPNWREARRKMQELEEQRNLFEKQLKDAGLAKNNDAQIPKEEIERIATRKSEEIYIQRYRDRVLSQFGDKKDDVAKYFDKLANGETLTEDAVDRLAQDAARALGVQVNNGRDISSLYGRAGGAPKFEQTSNDEGFGATERGRATAAAMGLIIEKPKS